MATASTTVKTGKHELVVGASSGVGRTTAHKVAPPDLIPSIKQRNPNVDVTHEPLDVSSLWDVRRFTDKHKDVEFDWIVMSPGMMTLNGRTETPEGLDVKMATHYYGRFTLIHDLLPTLNRPDVRVLNILAAATGGMPDVDDLDLKKTFSLKRCADFTATFSCILLLIRSPINDLQAYQQAALSSDLMAQAFSEKAPLATLMHADPGVVKTPLVGGLPWFMRLPAKALQPFVARSPEACCKVMASALTNEDLSAGWQLLSRYGEVLMPTKFQTEELKDDVRNHSVTVIYSVLDR